MADDDIKITITADDKASATFRAAGQAAEGFAKKTEGARLATWGLGEAAENAAQSLGIPNQMSRQLGNSVENLASRLGGAAMAFGALGLAAMAVYGIYQFVVERNKKLAEEARKAAEAKAKLRDEMVRSGDAAAAWLSRADKVIAKTREQRQAEYELYQVEFERNKEALSAGIRALEQKKLDLQKNSMDYVVIGNLALEVDQKRTKNLSLEIQHLEKQIALRRQQAQDAKMLSAGQFSSMGSGGDNKPKRGPEDYFNSVLAAEAAYSEQSLALARARGDSMAQIHQAETESFDAAAAARYATMQGEEEQRDFLAQNETRRQILLLKQAEEIEKQKQDMQKQSLDNFVQMSSLMASAGGKSARKWFSLQKTASIAQALINTYEGATKAYSQGGVWGVVLAASIIALGMAQVAKIRSQTFDGGSGASGGSVGTYSANPATGLPQQPAQQQAAFTLIINGTPIDVGQVMKEGMEYIYNNNGSTGGGLTVQVARSA